MKIKIKNYILKHKWFFVFLGILLITYFSMLPYIHESNIYTYNFYVVSYKYGFISRGMIGQIFNFFFFPVTIKKVYITLNVLFLLFLIAVSYFFSKFIRLFKEQNMAFIFILLCVFNPASFMLMITMNEFGRLDIFIFILTIISLVLIYKRKLLFLIPFIFGISMLIHQNFLFIYAPLLLVILLYEFFKSKEKRILFVFIVSFIFLSLTFLVVVKYGNMTDFKSAEEMIAAFRGSTDIPMPACSFCAIDAEYYKSMPEHLQLTWDRLKITPIKNFVIGITLLLSYIFVMLKFVDKEIFKKHRKRIILLLLSCMGATPLFFIGVDFGRWYIAIINCIVLLCLYLAVANRKNLDKLFSKHKNKTWIFIMFIIIYLILMQDTPFTFMDFHKINMILEKINYIFVNCFSVIKMIIY